MPVTLVHFLVLDIDCVGKRAYWAQAGQFVVVYSAKQLAAHKIDLTEE